MHNKSLVVILTMLVSAICLYALSFTWISRSVQQQADAYATTASGTIDVAQKQQYLDSLWDQPDFTILGHAYTFKEVKERELNLGLDLQGGMYLVIQVSPVEVLNTLANHTRNATFQRALQQAVREQAEENQPFLTLFYRAYRQQGSEVPLRSFFATSQNQGYVTQASSDKEVLAFLQQEIDEAVDRSFEIIRNRIDKFGVSQPTLQRLPGTERIQLELPGLDDPVRVRKLLMGVANLTFRPVVDPPVLASYWPRASQYWLEQHDQHPAATAADTATLEQQLQLDTMVASRQFPITALSTSPYSMTYALSDTAIVNRTLRELQTDHVLPESIDFLWEVSPRGDAQTLEVYAVQQGRETATLGGNVITDATQEFDDNQPSVLVQMNAAGTRKWKRITAENTGRQIAIVLDDQVYSAPVVQMEIPNGRSSISGNFTIEEAKDLANVLKAGKMPAPVQMVEEAVVGPSLGQESINQGLVSMGAGLALVVLFMVLYYGSGGLVANAALLFNIFFIVGVLAQLNASLTLPGIAGLVLTMGMSVDANVLIFERIKEELARGTSLSYAVRIGYDRAYSAIIDSNATTFLTGGILYLFGSGGIKGFAVVLMIGIVSSVFTAVFVSRVLIDYLVKQRRVIRFSTALSRGWFGHLSFDFIGYRTWAYRLSSLIILAGLTFIIVQGGLNVGVDFKGGRSYVVHFDHPVTTDQARTAMNQAFEGGGVEIKTFNQDNQLKITTSYLAHDHSEPADQRVRQTIEKGLQPFADEHPQILSSTKVGATIAQDVKDAAQSSVVYTLLVIFLYILVRFRKWQYGLGAVVALFHDVLMVFAAYAMARMAGIVIEIDQVFIAAILTVIGYSINDTVVVFDRVREFSGSTQKPLPALYNQAINDTLSRTVITSLTVFIVVAILLVFGGDVLRGFSFALLVGVVVGTYSSIFIAAPLSLDLDHWQRQQNKKLIPKNLNKA